MSSSPPPPPPPPPPHQKQQDIIPLYDPDLHSTVLICPSHKLSKKRHDDNHPQQVNNLAMNDLGTVEDLSSRAVCSHRTSIVRHGLADDENQQDEGKETSSYPDTESWGSPNFSLLSCKSSPQNDAANPAFASIGGAMEEDDWQMGDFQRSSPNVALSIRSWTSSTSLSDRLQKLKGKRNESNSGQSPDLRSSSSADSFYSALEAPPKHLPVITGSPLLQVHENWSGQDAPDCNNGTHKKLSANTFRPPPTGQSEFGKTDRDHIN